MFCVYQHTRVLSSKNFGKSAHYTRVFRVAPFQNYLSKTLYAKLLIVALQIYQCFFFPSFINFTSICIKDYGDLLNASLNGIQLF